MSPVEFVARLDNCVSFSLEGLHAAPERIIIRCMLPLLAIELGARIKKKLARVLESSESSNLMKSFLLPSFALTRISLMSAS